VAEIHRDVFLGIRQRASETAPITPEVVKSESNSDTLVVLNDLSEQEFDDLWDPARFQEWMLYLHPGQKRVVVEDMPKPCVFTGVSGSGKTCVLVHRAIRLAKAYPDESILVLSLNRSLAELIENHIRRLDATVKPRIRVMAFYDYLESLLKFHGLEDFLTSFGELLNIKEEVSKFVGSRELTQLNTLFDARDEYEIQRLWGDFCADPQSHAAKVALTRLTFYLYSQDQAIDAPRYLQEELTLVRSACRLSFHYKSYAQYARGGRCIPFQDKRREDVLELLRFWERHQLRHGKLDGMELTQAALVVLDDRGGSIPEHLRFRSVLVDEFQDFSTLDLELIAKIPKEALNGLFLTGDTAQKIYTKDFDLPGAGMGRGQRLDRSILKNYRNSRQILEAAHLLLESYADEATARHEGVSVLKPEYAQRDGARPFVCPTNDPFQAAWKLAGEWLAAGYPGFTICIATANPDVLSVRALRDAAPAGIATSRLTGDYQMRAEEVVVSDIYNIKGFEFSLIILVGMGASEFPPKGVPAGEIWREALRLYVAMTRGRDEVCLVHAGEASPFLEAMKAAVSPRPLAFAQPAKFAPATPAPIAPVAVPASDKPAPPPAIVAPPAGLPVMPVPAPGKVSTEPARPEAPKPSLVESVQGPGDRAPVPPPAEQQAKVINGVTLIRIEGEATVFSLAAVLGKEVVQIHNDVMNLGVYMNPSEALMPAFVYKVMDKYGCAPIFKK
jgi:superfamily I DNA/RNA helicase